MDMKETVINKLHLIRVQDVTLIVLCGLLIYLFRVQEETLLIPQWRYDFNISLYANKKYPSSFEKLPNPIITDLEGDDVSEVVLIDNDLNLKILVIPPFASYSVLPELKEKYVISLKTFVENSSYPVSIETGFLEVYKINSTRNQVIVLLMSDWKLLCFSSELVLLWEKHLFNSSQLNSDYYMKSAAIMITSNQLHRKDHGLIVVGAGFAHISHLTTHKTLRPLQTRKYIPPPKYHAKPASKTKGNENLNHFSTFGVSGSDGTIRWHHLPGDFQNEINKVNNFHWKLALRKGDHHAGEVHWTRYSGDIIHTLPFSWSRIEDSHIELGVIRKNELVNALKTKQDDSNSLADDLLGSLLSEDLIGLSYGGQKPHSKHEHVKNPNSVVIYNHNGIEVLSLFSGKPLTKMRFYEEKVGFADMNGDGGVHRVSLNFEDGKCQIEVASIHPSVEVSFHGPICYNPGLFGSMSLSSLFYFHPEVSENTQKSIEPVFVKSVAVRSGVFQHIMGHALPSQRSGHDIITLTSTGHLTSYGPSGEFNWQTFVPAKWADIVYMITSKKDFNSEKEGIFYNAFQPSMKGFSLQIYGKKDLMAIVGWNTVTIVDLKDGRVLADHSIPCQPINVLKVADFNNDGYNDLIVPCPSGYIGMVLKVKPNFIYMIIVSFAVVIAIMMLIWCFQSEVSEYAE